METNNKNLAEVKETWTKPELVVASITETTLGGGGAGFDFASEVS